MKSIELDYTKRCAGEPEKGHNRWHPDIPPAVEVEPGEEVVLQTRNAFDGEVTPATRPGDLNTVNLGVVHPLTGPVYVQGAQPGDLLEVNILEIEPASWGFTTIIPGFGFLRDVFPDPYIVHWDIKDDFAESSQLPGVRVPGAPFMGTIGVAPLPVCCDRKFCCARTNCCVAAVRSWGRTPQALCPPRSLWPRRD